MNDIPQSAMAWIVNGERGISSEAIWARMTGQKSKRDYWNYPHDPSDLNRCLKLLADVPEWRSRLSEMAAEGKAWAALVKHWDELEKMFVEEVGWDWSKKKSAPKTYKRMREILAPAESDETQKRGIVIRL